MKSSIWNFHPKLPISMSPVFDLPPKPKAAIAWLLGTWTRLTPPVSHMAFALVVLLLLWPELASFEQLSWRSGFGIFLINAGAVIVLAGALHLYLYSFKAQDKQLKFDPRPMEKSQRFTFNNQLWDNVFWTLASGVPIWSLWMLLYFWCAANGWIPTHPGFTSGPVWFILFFFVIRFWQSFHFFCIHKLLHIPFLFKSVHHIHHRNVSVGPWSGLSMHPVEHLFYYSGILIHFVLPSHPLHVIFHMFALNLGAVYSHSGFEKLLVKNKETMKMGSFHHQLHHKYFQCNYGSEEIPLDRWFDSFHDGTREATQKARERAARLFRKK